MHCPRTANQTPRSSATRQGINAVAKMRAALRTLPRILSGRGLMPVASVRRYSAISFSDNTLPHCARIAVPIDVETRV